MKHVDWLRFLAINSTIILILRYSMQTDFGRCFQLITFWSLWRGSLRIQSFFALCSSLRRWLVVHENFFHYASFTEVLLEFEGMYLGIFTYWWSAFEVWFRAPGFIIILLYAGLGSDRQGVGVASKWVHYRYWRCKGEADSPKRSQWTHLCWRIASIGILHKNGILFYD